MPIISLYCKYRNGYKINKLYSENAKPIKKLTIFFYIAYNKKRKRGRNMTKEEKIELTESYERRYYAGEAMTIK